MAEKILIIDDDLDTLRLVGLILERHGYEITTANRGLLGLKKAVEEHPDLIVLDIMMPEMDGYDVARRLRENKLTAKIPILMFTAKTQMDDKVAGFDAGADGYITKPTHPSELKSNVMTLLARAGHQADDSEAAVPLTRGFVIAVLSASGGAGVSSLAINLGTSLFNQTHADVVLAEFTPGRGSLALDLGLGNGKEAGLTKILSASPEDISRAMVAAQFIPHKSGFKTLLASNRPEDTHLIDNTAQYENLLARLSTLGRFILLDMGMGLPPVMQKLLPQINELILVLEGSTDAITPARSLINNLVELGVSDGHLSVVLNNHVRSEDQMSLADVQKELGHPIAATLTPAPELFQQAARMHLPAVVCQPSSLTTQQIGNLVDLIIEREAKE
jgi:DNA-binding response OmpR family regulator